MGYRGEVMLKFKPTDRFIKIPVDKEGEYDYNSYEVGDRIGQLIVMPYPHVTLVESDELSESVRGKGGFGSTNK